MKYTQLILAFALGMLAFICGPWASAATDEDVLMLVDGNAPVCKLVMIADKPSDSLLNGSADLVAGTIRNWSGAEVPRVALDETVKQLPAEPVIVFATLSSLRKIAPDLAADKEIAKAAEIDEQGFVVVPRTRQSARQLLVVSQTARGVYNGAVYLRDFCIDGDKQKLSAQFQPVVRSPKMGGRSAYVLTIWGQECKYTSADWETEFRSFARDGIDRVYFWVSGNFPSKKFPQTYKCKNVFEGKLYDTTEETRIGTVQDLKDIVASAHKLGLKIYLGGGLGAWCGTQFITNLEPETLKIGPKEQSLCPSNPKSRAALIDYYDEVFSALPEADGLFIESADEIGACNCPLCSKAIDDLGSRQFGQAQLTLCQEIMAKVWPLNPNAHLAYTIGYSEHAKDVAYYDLIQRMSKDPRMEWMEARGSWTFPGPGGESHPAAYFSNRVMRWKEYYKIPLGEMIAEANRIGSDGMYGMTMCFSPGYATGSFYNDIPFPADILPYALTGFVYREATWDPSLTVEEIQDRTQKRFFGKDAPKYLTADLWKLREMIRARRGVKELDAIEAHIKEARTTANPKTTEGLNLMTRAAEDIRKYSAQKRKGNS